MRAAHTRFVVLVASCAIGAFVCYPRWSDGARAGSLNMLDTVMAELDVGAVERELVAQAERSQAQSLQKIAERVAGTGVKDLTAPDLKVQLFRATRVTLGTLGEIEAQSRTGRAVKLLGPDIDRLATSLRFRIARMGGGESVRLEGLEALDGSASQAQLDAEQSVEPARLAAVEARRESERETSRLEFYGERVKAMSKAKAPGKDQWKMQEKRREAEADMQAAEEAMQAALDTYRARADAALAFRAGTTDDAAPGVVVKATLSREGENTAFVIPVARSERTRVAGPVAVPASLATLAQENLWGEISRMTPTEAQTYMRGLLSWHLSGQKIGPLRIGGVTVLQLFPLVLLVLLISLSRQCARVRRAYSPFDHPGIDLPGIGTRNEKLDLALLVVPVSAVIALDVWALARIDRMWWVAVLLGSVVGVYAVLAVQAWTDMRQLRTNILRTTFPPPLR